MAKKFTERTFTAWLVLTRARDVAGQWVAHCLDFDVVTQGDSMLHAVEMAYDALGIVLVDDHKKGLDPYLRRAPQSFWDKFYEVFSRAIPIKGQVKDLNERDIGTLIGQISISVKCEDHKRSEKYSCSLPILLETTRDTPHSAPPQA